jgi:hypothetical protein
MLLVSGEGPKSSCCYCGSELSANALYCKKCLVPIAQPARHRRPGTLSLILGVSLIFGGPSAWVIAGQFHGQFLRAPLSRTTVHAASILSPVVVDQAVALIRSCGAPDRDVSTANNDPRPPIPFRVLDYNDQHLQFAFVPGGGAKIGDPPPYRWSLSGVLDSTTNQRISIQQAADRMNCAAPLVALANAAASAAPATDPSPSANSETASPADPDPQ